MRRNLSRGVEQNRSLSFTRPGGGGGGCFYILSRGVRLNSGICSPNLLPPVGNRSWWQGLASGDSHVVVVDSGGLAGGARRGHQPTCRFMTWGATGTEGRQAAGVHSTSPSMYYPALALNPSSFVTNIGTLKWSLKVTGRKSGACRLVAYRRLKTKNSHEYRRQSDPANDRAD